MKQFSVWFVPLLLTQSLSLKADPTLLAKNLVSSYLNKVLDSVFAQLKTSKISLPEISLGAETGKFSNVEISARGEMNKTVDGVQSFGFKLNTGMEEILIEGEYDLLYLDVPGLFPFFGKGNFSIVLDLINLNMKLTADYDSDEEKFNIAVPDFEILIHNSTVKFENLMNDSHLADFLNELLSKLLPDVIKIISNPLKELMMPLIDYYGNGIIICIKKEFLSGKIDECIKNLFIENNSHLTSVEPKIIIDLSRFVNFQLSLNIN